MGLKSRIAGWAIGKGVGEFLKHRTRFNQDTRRHIVKVVRMAMKPKSPKDEPVLYAAAASVVADLVGAYGLELEPEALATTISTVVVLVSFVARRFTTPAQKP